MELGVGKARVNCVGIGRHGVVRVRRELRGQRESWVGSP